MLDISKAAIQKDGKFLLLRRSPDSWNHPNVRDFPGGRCEPGESPVDIIMREIKEETGLDIEPGEEVKHTAYHDEKIPDAIIHYFAPLSVKGEPRLSSEHTAMGRFTREEIKDMETTPSLKLFFDFPL